MAHEFQRPTIIGHPGRGDAGTRRMGIALRNSKEPAACRDSSRNDVGRWSMTAWERLREGSEPFWSGEKYGETASAHFNGEASTIGLLDQLPLDSKLGDIPFANDCGQFERGPPANE